MVGVRFYLPAPKKGNIMARRRKDKKEENATLKAFKEAREAKKKEKDSASKKASDSAKITNKNKKNGV